MARNHSSDHAVNGAGHNHDHADHLHSHLAPADDAADLQVLTKQFIDGFQTAADKTSYRRLAGVPFEIAGNARQPSLKLVDVALNTEWQIGTASPSFGSRELSYLTYSGEMLTERTNMAFVYVSIDANTNGRSKGFPAGAGRGIRKRLGLYQPVDEVGTGHKRPGLIL